MKFDQIVPVLRVKDARASEAFYCGILGFTKNWEHQFGLEFPLLMSISFTGCTLMISEHVGTGSDNCDIYVNIDDVDGFFQTASGKGLVFEKSPVNESWGMREAAFRDPDNHRFTLGSIAS